MTLMSAAPLFMFAEFVLTLLFLAAGLIVGGLIVRKMINSYIESRAQRDMAAQAVVEAARARARARASAR